MPEWTEARLMAIIESAMDGIITIDESHRVVLFNSAAERMFRVSAAEAIGSPIERFIPERFREGHGEHVRTFAATGVTMRKMGRLGSLSGLRADGKEFPIEASISQTALGGQRLYTVILRDVTERKQLEEQLLQAQKMEVIGRLAGGIAHDFNNLLMAIINYLTLATKGLDPEHPSRAALSQVQEASNRAATLTRQLLIFARKQATKPRVVSVVELVSGLEPMLRRLLSDEHELRAEVAADTGNVRVDPTQLEQVIMNLVVNARDAMPEGGRVTIRTSSTVLDRDYCLSVVGASPGPHVVIEVVDSGVGMTPEVQAQIFEPFFTTKEPGKGTGLGLATCHGIVTEHGGHFTVRSAPGAGTTIRALLPRIDAAALPQQSDQPVEGLRGTETVLLAEDSALVRELIAGGLRQAGYTVLSAVNGADALRVADAHHGPIHLIVADVNMPGMSGPELAAGLATRRGPTPVLYMTGGPGVTVGAPPGEQVLPKPFTTDILLRRIREVLERTRPS